MIELQTNNPALTVRVYAQYEIVEIEPPKERFVVVSVTDTDRRAGRVNLTGLGSAPLLRLPFLTGQLPEEQAVLFWQFLRDHLSGLDVVLLHCSAGAVRSPALAAALVKAFGGGDWLLWTACKPGILSYRRLVGTFPRIFGHPISSNPNDS